MNVSEAEILAALDELRSLHLVNTVIGSRVVRYEHNGARALGVPGAGLAILTQLMLRGPQRPPSCAPTPSGCTALRMCPRSKASSMNSLAASGRWWCACPRPRRA